MSVYRVTVTVRALVSVQADDDIQAGSIAFAYLDGCVTSGQTTLPVPAEVKGFAWNTFVQAATTDEGA